MKSGSMTFLKWLDGMCQKVPAEFLADTHLAPVDPAETILGVVSPDIRPLWAVTQQLTNQALRLSHSHREQHLTPGSLGCTKNEEACLSAAKSVKTLAEQAEVARDLFWISLRHQLEYPGDDIGIRAGWQVVKTPRRVTIIDILASGMPEI